MRRILIPALAALLSVTAHADSLDDLAGAELKLRGIPGMSIAVVRNGRVEAVRGYGFADLEHKTPATPDTVYQLASVTKQFTASAVMLLVEEGRIGLDDPIRRHLPNLPEKWQDVTVRMLLNHTSGIPSYTSFPDLMRDPRRRFAPDEVVKTMAEKPLDFVPGTRFSYNNTGYYLLGHLLEKVSGKDYNTLLQERLFRSAGMTGTQLNRLEDVIPNRAGGYTRTPNGTANAPQTHPSQPFSAGALVSTAADMAKWDIALTNGTVLKPSVLKQMWAPAALKGGGTSSYGFGWQLETMNGIPVISHGGGITGSSTYFMRVPSKNLSVIVLCNSDNGNATQTARKVAALYASELAQKPAAAVEDKHPEITRMLFATVAAIHKGTVKDTNFTPAFWKVVEPIFRGPAQQDLKQLGELKRLELLESRMQGENRMLRYRAEFANETAELKAVVTGDGKIGGLSLSPG